MASVFSREFKTQIVELFRQGGRTFTDIAQEYDISATTVANWVRADANARGQLLSEAGEQEPQESERSDKAEIAALKRQLRQREEELEILGKALAFFARRKDQ